MIALFATYIRPRAGRVLTLLPYHVNLSTCIALRQLPEHQLAIEAADVDSLPFKGFLCQIDFPGGGEDGTSLYANGTVEDILMRWRGLRQSGGV